MNFNAKLSWPIPALVLRQLFWSAHENELRVHNAVDLERHAGHGTSGLPEQALFRFCATGRGAPTVHHRAAVDEVGSGRRLSDGGDRLMVRDVESVELGDGRTVLMCLVSAPGLKSEVRQLPSPAGRCRGCGREHEGVFTDGGREPFACRNFVGTRICTLAVRHTRMIQRGDASHPCGSNRGF